MHFSSEEATLGDFRYEREIRAGDIDNKVMHSEQLWTKLYSILSFHEKIEVEKARVFAENLEYVHPGLDSKTYLVHPLRVATLSGLFTTQDKLLTAKVGLLHNVYEVGVVEPTTIIEQFGQGVHLALETLKVDRDRQPNLQYLSDYYDAIAQLPNGLGIIKVVDKIDNLYTLNLTASSETRLRYLSEIEKFVVPLCEDVSPQISQILLNIIRAS
jgi:(p)ppGpp synthase/HD superfamily hydrolase